MATSGSTDFTLTRDQIIVQAREYIDAIATQGTPSAAELISDSQSLNMMVKAWQTEGIALWKNSEATLYLEEDKQSYLLGATGDHCAIEPVETEVRVIALTGATTLEVDSTTGMTTGDVCGVELDDGTLQWTTATVTDGDTLELGDVLTDDVSVDAQVFTYTSLIPRPIEISNVRFVNTSGNETHISTIAREEYMALSTKDTTGEANQVYYDPQTINGKLYVWPAADDETEYIKLTIRTQIEDFDAASDNADIPVEMLEAVVLNLAKRLYYKYRPDLTDRHLSSLRADAKFAKDALKGLDVEPESLYLVQSGQGDIGGE